MAECIRLEGKLLREVQLTELEILKTVAKFCEENGIRYCLTSGTLLGAVRHGGFIPWDDDIDIAMPRKDFETFLKLAHRLPAEYICQATRFDSNYPIPIVKIRKHGTLMKEPDMAHLNIEHGIWIDIFPLDKVKDTNNLKLRAKLIHLLTTAIGYTVGSSHPCKTRTIVISKLLGILGVSKLDKIRTHFMMRDENKPSTLLTNFASNLGYKNLLMNESVFFPFGKMKFEDEYFFVPANPEEWLTKAYGKYMILPPKEQRINRHKVVEIRP